MMLDQTDTMCDWPSPVPHIFENIIEETGLFYVNRKQKTKNQHFVYMGDFKLQPGGQQG